jgi:hypothetical protein
MMIPQFVVGTPVRVLPAYRQPMGGQPAHFVPDGSEGIYVVVGHSKTDVLVVRAGESISALIAAVASGEITAADYDYAVCPDRLTTDLLRTER